MGDPQYMRRALVVEDDPLTRSLLESLLVVAQFEVRACASSREALGEFERFDPDVLVVDIQLAERPNGAQLAAALSASAPHLAIVVVSHYPSPEAAGLRQPLPDRAAFINKDQVTRSAVLLDAIESALDDARAPVVKTSVTGERLAALTPVQLEVLRMIAIGLSNAEIARRRGVAKRTAEDSVQRVYVALGLDSAPAGERNARVEATRIYVSAFGMPIDEDTPAA
ncbi:MAG: response regulator [Actinomycetota bacterium]